MMAIQINQNLPSANMQRNLVERTSGEPLTSDMRPQRHTIEPQNVELSAKFGLDQEANAKVQIAELGLIEVSEGLQKLGDLTRLSLSETTYAADRDRINQEFQAITVGLMERAATAKYSDNKIDERALKTENRILASETSFDLSSITLIGTDDPEDGILTRSHNGVRISSDEFNISSSSTREQREAVLQSIERMSSDVINARSALSTFQGEVYPSAYQMSNDDDLGLYSPLGPESVAYEREEAFIRKQMQAVIDGSQRRDEEQKQSLPHINRVLFL